MWETNNTSVIKKDNTILHKHVRNIKMTYAVQQIFAFYGDILQKFTRENSLQELMQ